MSGTWMKGEESAAFDTLCVHGGVKPCPETGAILTPIHQATTFVQSSIDEYLGKGYSYSRTANPTVKVLEAKIALLEKATGSVCFSTGMAATVSVMSAFLGSGDHCVLTNCSYGGTNRVAREHFAKYGVRFSFVDFTDVGAVAAAITPATKLLFSETPANPTLTLTDVRAVSELARARGVLHVCDATFGTPLMVRPLELGCDLSLHSTTKYFDGHNMTVGGCVSARDAALVDALEFQRNMHGNIMAPQTAFLTLQALKTMGVRCAKQAANAAAVAAYLEAHPKIAVVRYPGLASFPQKALADAQHRNGFHGGMLWCEVKGGSAAGRKLMDSTPRPWSLCENLGAVESIITCPAVMTHANMLPEDRLKVGITDGFVRVSCGVEDADDLIAALDVALAQL